ncbi:hypothetical protein FB451DRAFT_1176092 [Mycena latifolia]|nr:hypothetical protein FB451DRAFT_1176092 [Mycena latifolia]
MTGIALFEKDCRATITTQATELKAAADVPFASCYQTCVQDMWNELPGDQRGRYETRASEAPHCVQRVDSRRALAVARSAHLAALWVVPPHNLASPIAPRPERGGPVAIRSLNTVPVTVATNQADFPRAAQEALEALSSNGQLGKLELTLFWAYRESDGDLRHGIINAHSSTQVPDMADVMKGWDDTIALPWKEFADQNIPYFDMRKQTPETFLVDDGDAPWADIAKYYDSEKFTLPILLRAPDLPEIYRLAEYLTAKSKSELHTFVFRWPEPEGSESSNPRLSESRMSPENSKKFHPGPLSVTIGNESLRRPMT